MNAPYSMIEQSLLFPLWLIATGLTGSSDWMGRVVLVAFLALIGLWIAVFVRWKQEKRRSRFVAVFLVAILGFPLVNFLIMVKTFGAIPAFPLVNQFVLVVQSCFSLSVLTHCEIYWQQRGRARAITATLTTVMAAQIWLITGFCYALTLQ